MTATHSGSHASRCEKLDGAPRALDGFAAISIASGELWVSVPSENAWRLVAGDALVLGPGAAARIRARTPTCEVLRFDAEAAWAEALLQLASPGPASERAAAIAVCRAATPAARRTRQILRELALPRQPDAAHGAMHRTRAVAELLALGIETATSPPASPSRAGAATRAAFIAAVSELGERDDLAGVSLDQFAAGCSLSVRQASRLFRIELGATFREHLTRIRVDRARRMLAESSLPVVQVAAETGWSSLAHFNSVFRRFTGTTPSAYRAECGRDA